MSLMDTIHGPSWTLWVVFVIFAVISAIQLSGHGENLIAGFNTAGRDRKANYDTKKLCRVCGAGMSAVGLLVLIMALFAKQLPASFAYIFLGVTLADVAVMLVLMNTVCKKK